MRALAALLTAGLVWLPFSAQAAIPLPPDPFSIIAVGNDLLALSQDQHLWRRDRRQGADWQRVAPLADETDFRVFSLICATDTSGICVVAMVGDHGAHWDLFKTGKGLIRTLDLKASTIVGMPDGETLYLWRARGNEGEIWKHDISSGQETLIGPMHPGESFMMLPVDGKQTPLARTIMGNYREISNAPDAPRFHFGDNDNSMVSADGLLDRQGWSQIPKARDGMLGLADVQFRRSVENNRSVIKVTGNWVTYFPVAGVIPDAHNGAVDANNDAVIEVVGPSVDRLSVLCQSPGGPHLQYLADIRPGQTTKISASQAASGFMLVTTGPTHTPLYQTLTLSPAPGGWRKRPCAGSTGTIVDANVIVTDNSNVEITQGSATAADGTKIPYTMMTPRNVIPEHVIIDVYGAYGARRELDAYQPETIGVLEQTRTAVVFPIVRGDGNMGYNWAMASATPHRDVAVDDVIAVAREISSRLPTLKAKPTLRGRSAGGWLAVRAALARPDLFAGAIGYSGAYLFKGDPLAVLNSQHFFDDQKDDLAAPVQALKRDCHGLHFRLLHAKDDAILSYARVEDFAHLLSAQGCAVDLVSFDHGGHAIELTAGQKADAKRRLNAYFTPF